MFPAKYVICQRHLSVFTNDQGPVPNHVITVIANNSGHMIRQTFPPPGHNNPFKGMLGQVGRANLVYDLVSASNLSGLHSALTSTRLNTFDYNCNANCEPTSKPNLTNAFLAA